MKPIRALIDKIIDANQRQHIQTITITYEKFKEDSVTPELTIDTYSDEVFNQFQLDMISLGLESGVDVSAYANPAFDLEQMSAILGGLKDGLDVTIYAKPEYSVKEMYAMRFQLEKQQK